MFNIFKKDKSLTKIPKHIAFICDGNRRWAESRGMPPLFGHKAGISNFENLTKWFLNKGVETVTFFIFSTENWSRTKEEVDFLMNLFYTEMKNNLKYAIKNNIRYRVVGSRDRLPKKLADICDELEEKTSENTEGTVVFALNYGGQDEILNAVNSAIENGKFLNKEEFETFLDTGDLLPIDLLVRTSNENRISNFMLWKLAYAELLFIKPHWPEFVKSEKLWNFVLEEYSKRNRRFGGGKKLNYSGKKNKK